MPRNISGGRISAALTRITAARGLIFSKAIVNSDADRCISSKNTDAISSTHNRASGPRYLSAMTPPKK